MAGSLGGRTSNTYAQASPLHLPGIEPSPVQCSLELLHVPQVCCHQAVLLPRQLLHMMQHVRRRRRERSACCCCSCRLLLIASAIAVHCLATAIDVVVLMVFVLLLLLVLCLLWCCT